MAIRIPWDEYEAALLLDALIRVLNDEISRKDAIQHVSKTLRTRAIQRGIQIDDIYRNTNGITLQMGVMEYLYTEGKHGLKKPTMPKLFQHVIDKYKNDRNYYDVLVKEAVAMPNENIVEEQFYKWLSTQVASNRLSEMYMALNDINKFCLERKILRVPLLETIDLSILNNVRKTVEGNRVFRFLHKKQLSKMQVGISKYISFVKANRERLAFKEASSNIPVKTKRCVSEKSDLADNNVHIVSEIAHENSMIKSDEIDNRKMFIEWMQARGSATATIRSYISAIGQCTKSAQQLVIIKNDLFAIKNVSELIQIRDSLLSVPSFKQLNDQQHNRFLSAMNKLIVFRQNLGIDKEQSGNEKKEVSNSLTISVEVTEKYEHILSVFFGEDGYQPGRAIFRGRFKKYFNSEYGFNPSESDDCIDEILQKIGTIRDGRVFPKQENDQDNLLNEIIENILSAFEEGASGIYIEAVFEKYKLQLADSLQVYNMEALTPMLLEKCKGKFVQKYSYLVREWENADSAGDILRIMQSFHQPQNYEVIHEKVWYIPYDKMKTLLVLDKSIVNVAPETYFYAPNLPISSTELRQLITVIHTELEYQTHLTDVELRELIRKKCPTIAINTDGYTTYGLRNCLGYILRDHFSFNGPIISELGKELSMSDVYAEFARNHAELSLEDLKRFSSDMNISIYWDSVLEEMVRVSDKKMIRRDLICFDVDVIDNILDRMCPGQYVAIKDINLFLQFPNIGYAWNQYVLESYLFKNSCKFKLLHVSFGQNSVCGAMVRGNAPISDYRTLILDALSRSSALESAKSALQYIVDCGYQQRRRYDGIEQIVKEAKILKEQRENEER